MIKFQNLLGLALLFLAAGILRGQIPVADDEHLNSHRLGPRTEQPDFQHYRHVWHVSVMTGADKKGDGSRQKPWKTIAYALEKAAGSSAYSRVALCIAAGEYPEKTLVMLKHADLFGGFDPVTWDRDIFRNRTVLDGQGVRRVVIGADSARIDGFTIMNGLSEAHGAGILCDDTSPEISNNIIKDNTVLGPASFNTARIHQEGNQGGGIACRFNAVPEIRNNLICGNRTAVGNGAGIAFYGWVRKPGMPDNETVDNRITGGLRAMVADNVIMFNQAGVNDLFRTRSSNGGGISVGYEARPLIVNNLIAMNDAGGRGDAGGIYIEYFADPDITGNWILGNTSDDDGGGLYTMRLGQPLIEGNIISGNYTRSGGAGAVRISKEGRATIRSNLIAQNRGGGITSVDSYAEIYGNMIVQNSGRPGISISSKFTYFKPTAVAGNYFLDNPAGNISVTGTENVEMPPDEDTARKVAVVAQASLDIAGMTFNAADYETILSPQTQDFPASELHGRVVRIGESWSLVKSAADGRLVIWGAVSAGQSSQLKLDFLPLYNAGKGSREPK